VKFLVHDSRRASVSRSVAYWKCSLYEAASSHLEPMFRPLFGSKRESGQTKALKWFTLVLPIFQAGNPEKYFVKIATPFVKKYSQVKVQFRWKIFTGYTLAAL